GARDFILELHHPAFDEALALARRVIFGVFGDIALLARFRDRADDGRAVDGLKSLQLLLQTAVAAGGHRNFRHKGGLSPWRSHRKALRNQRSERSFKIGLYGGDFKT